VRPSIKHTIPAAANSGFDPIACRTGTHSLLGYPWGVHARPSHISVFNGLAALIGMWLPIWPWVLNYRAIVPAFWSAIVAGLVGCVGAGLATVKQQQRLA